MLYVKLINTHWRGYLKTDDLLGVVLRWRFPECDDICDQLRFKGEHRCI